MALTPFFGGVLLLLWLAIGTIGWLIAALRRPGGVSVLAWGAALIVAVVAGALPALIGWRTLPALLVGLLLAFVCATAAALWLTRDNC